MRKRTWDDEQPPSTRKRWDSPDEDGIHNAEDARERGIRVQKLAKTYKVARGNIVKSMVKTLSAAVVSRAHVPKNCETETPAGDNMISYFIGESECVSIVSKVPPKNSGVIFFSRNEREHSFGLCGMRVSGARVKEGGGLAKDTREFMPTGGGHRGPATLLVGMVIPNPNYARLSVKSSRAVPKLAFKWWIEGGSIVAFLEAVVGGKAVVLDTLRQQLRQSVAPHDELFAGYKLINLADIDYFLKQQAMPEADRELSLSVDPLTFMVRVAMASEDEDLIQDVLKVLPPGMNNMLLKEPHAGATDPMVRVGQSSDTLLLDHAIFVEGLTMADAEESLGLRPFHVRKAELDATFAEAAAAVPLHPTGDPPVINMMGAVPTSPAFCPRSPSSPYKPTSPGDWDPIDGAGGGGNTPPPEPWIPSPPPLPPVPPGSPPAVAVDPRLAALSAGY